MKWGSRGEKECLRIKSGGGNYVAEGFCIEIAWKK